MNELEEEEAAPAPRGGIVLAKTRSILATVADISALLESNSREFFMVSFVDQNNGEFSMPIGKGFYDRNASRFVLDTCVSLTIESTILGRTQYKDKNTGDIKTHKSTGDNVRSIVKATSRQISAIGRADTMNFIKNDLQGILEGIGDTVLQGNMAMLLAKTL